MLDQRLVRDNPEAITSALGRRGKAVDLTRLQLIAQQQRDLEETRSSLQADGNRIGKEVGKRIQGGADPKSEEVAALRREGNTIKQRVAVLEEEEKQLSNQLRDQLLTYPNLPAEDCPDGKDETNNVELRRWGTPLEKTGLEEHWQIAERLGLFETERSVRIAQSRFVTLMGQGARLERALINFMLDLHTSKGYREVLPPVLVNSASLTGSGQLPKFAEESFRCAEDDLWLTPTAEVPVTSLHRDEIIPVDQLPLRYAAYSPCFRREAGSYGRDTRGLIRLHQFNKVELYWFVHPDQSADAHEQITADAEAVLQALELPYRVLDLCTGDLGWPNAPTTLKSGCRVQGYREISSCSVGRLPGGAPQFARRKEKTPGGAHLERQWPGRRAHDGSSSGNEGQPDGSVGCPRPSSPTSAASYCSHNDPIRGMTPA